MMNNFRKITIKTNMKTKTALRAKTTRQHLMHIMIEIHVKTTTKAIMKTATNTVMKTGM